MLVIPSPWLGQGTYIDENALQPGQVQTYWNWADVHQADTYLAALENLRDKNATSNEIAQYIIDEFEKIGIPARTQQYSFTTATGVNLNGTNAYAVLSSPRASGTEAIVISASWISRSGEGDGTLNLRGVSTVLALAGFLKNYSLWAKDLIFVVSDGYLDGMQAWITTYHGVSQPNLRADPLALSSGVIWTALNIDYPGHSFSHLGVFFEGLNGRLPNQDLLNSFGVISRHTGNVPVLVYDHLDPREFPGREHELTNIPAWIPDLIKEYDGVKEYAARAKNIVRHVNYQARGTASGVHGLLHQFRIDAITLFAVPAPGPHGFHAIGRVVESTLRTTNNLLERLHASFFFFLLVGPTTFMKIGSYLPSAIIISTAMMFGGLGEWVNAGWTLATGSVETTDQKKGHASSEGKWTRRHRPMLVPIAIMISTHLAGIMLFFVISRSWYAAHQIAYSAVLFSVISAVPPLILMTSTSSSTHAPLPTLLKSLNLCLASTVISITSVLNFSLAATLAVVLGLPLSFASSARTFPTRLAIYGGYITLGFGWLLLCQEEMRNAIWNWEVLGVWFAPFVCIVYTPLVLQAALVCLLPP
ncbi:GPI transamidase component gaa1 [Grifola frondosa]|uniref:GPI transamidase component gaa1 n=1 Tax=Grifola frondosa TaxID=5627 RepID=A0A1C7MGN4_GRIFR|nr:GPI transamidase component gaa1 [Grifola frondosa]